MVIKKNLSDIEQFVKNGADVKEDVPKKKMKRRMRKIPVPIYFDYELLEAINRHVEKHALEYDNRSRFITQTMYEKMKEVGEL